MLTLPHNLVNLAVLLAAHKLLMFIGKLDLDTHLVLRTLHEGNLMDDHHSGFHCVVGSVDGKGELVEAYIAAGIRANIGEHSPDV